MADLSVYTLSAPIEAVMPDCGLALIQTHLRQAARYFAQHTWTLRDEVSIETVIGQTIYPLTPTVDGIILGLTRLVSYDGDDCVPGGIGMLPDTTLELPWEPTADDVVVTVEIAQLQNGDVYELPEAWVRLHTEALSERCKYTLYSVPKMPWTSPEGAFLAQAQYQRAQFIAQAQQHAGIDATKQHRLTGRRFF